MKTLLLFLVLASAVLVGCDSIQSKPSDAAVAGAVQNMRYFQDAHTGQCFAGFSSASSGTTYQMMLTWVPCDQKVLEAIGKTQ